MTNLNRRVFFAGAGALALGGAANASGKTHKIIPSTKETVPAIGMGSWLTFDVGQNQRARAQRTEVLRTFFDMGGALIDSSPMYGTSQAVIGHALDAIKPARDAVFAADKVWISGGENGPPQIRTTAERWGVERFDLLQVHNLRSWQAHLETLQAMKAEGRLRLVGVTSYAGLRYREIAAIMENQPLDFIQVTYNLADREAEQRLLPLARERGIAVIANRPFREGALINHVRRFPLPAMAADIDAENWAQFLLKFIISHDAITAAIPATRRVDHMRENMGALSGPLPDPAFRQGMITAFENL